MTRFFLFAATSNIKVNTILKSQIINERSVHVYRENLILKTLIINKKN